MNRTRRKTYCDECGSPIMTSPANPKDICKRCEDKEFENETDRLATLKRAHRILNRLAKTDKCTETQECANILEAIIGDIDDVMKSRVLMQKQKDELAAHVLECHSGS